MRITFVQTADPIVYSKFIDLTSLTVKEHCARQGHEYECFLGIKRGAKPWHASCNRIPILNSYLQSGYDGWFIYIDADAYIADVDFDIASYLSGKSEYAMIAAGSGHEPPVWWDVNAGVFALNFGHPQGRTIAKMWYDLFMEVPAEEFSAEEKWGDVFDDQAALHKLLRENEDIMRDVLFRDDASPRIFNWYGAYVRQYVRETGSIEKRLSVLREGVAEALSQEKIPTFDPDGEESPLERQARFRVCDEIGEAIYRGILNREPDEGGLSAVQHKLRHGVSTFEAEFRSCIGSHEFAVRIDEILERARRG